MANFTFINVFVVDRRGFYGYRTAGNKCSVQSVIGFHGHAFFSYDVISCPPDNGGRISAVGNTRQIFGHSVHDRTGRRFQNCYLLRWNWFLIKNKNVSNYYTLNTKHSVIYIFNFHNNIIKPD